MTYQKIESELTTSESQSEELKSVQQKGKKVPAHLHHINKTKQTLDQIKRDLLSIIDAFAKNPSVFSQAAVFWSKISFWEKIGVGVGLAAPLLVIGILAHLAVIITLGIVTALVYTASSMLLDNHQDQFNSNSEQLKSDITNLANLMNSVIFSLDMLREQLALEIESFQNEIAKLQNSIGQLGAQIETLKIEIKQLTQSEQMLRSTIEKLENTLKALGETITEQSELLKQAQNELDRVIKEYDEKQKKLTDEIEQLNVVKDNLNKELTQVQSLSNILNETVVALSQTVIADSEQRAAFHKRLEDFLNNKEYSFDRIVERICNAEHQLALVTRQLEEANQRHESLLDVQEQHLAWFEQKREQLVSKDEVQVEVTLKPNIFGFYAIKKESSCGAIPTLIPTHGTAMIGVV